MGQLAGNDGQDLKSIDAKEKRQAAVRDALRDLNVQIDRVFVTVEVREAVEE